MTTLVRYSNRCLNQADGLEIGLYRIKVPPAYDDRIGLMSRDYYKDYYRRNNSRAGQKIKGGTNL